MRELARIQTFPDDVKVTGSRGEVQRQIGNAVPALLAEVLARAIRAQFLGTQARGRLKLMPPDRSPCPPAEKAHPVPARFHDRIGNHAPHPGTGLGRAAVARNAASV